MPSDFDIVLGLIDGSRAVAAVSTELIVLYWSIGESIGRRISAAGWGQGTVKALAEPLRRHHLNVRGGSAQNLWRMRPFFETYDDRPKPPALLRELSRINYLLILGKCQRDESRPGREPADLARR